MESSMPTIKKLPEGEMRIYHKGEVAAGRYAAAAQWIDKIWEVLPDPMDPEVIAQALLNVLAKLIVLGGGENAGKIAADYAKAMPDFVRFYSDIERSKDQPPTHTTQQ
jgi:hypothetical protein